LAGRILFEHPTREIEKTGPLAALHYPVLHRQPIIERAAMTPNSVAKFHALAQASKIVGGRAPRGARAWSRALPQLEVRDAVVPVTVVVVFVLHHRALSHKGVLRMRHKCFGIRNRKEYGCFLPGEKARSWTGQRGRPI
jgi:hypothetical protein